MYQAYIVQIDDLRKHPNADRLQIATIFGENVIVSLDVQLGNIGIYFPVGGQLNERFCDENHLCRKKSDGTPDSGYLERHQRAVKAIRLRGEKSEGLFMPISSLSYLGVEPSDYKIGTPITVVNGEEICCKYIPKGNRSRRGNGQSKRPFISKHDIAPTFYEHDETEQLAYNLNAFKYGDDIEITLKMHGTSQRTAYVPVLKDYRTRNPFYAHLIKAYKENKKIGKFGQKWLKEAFKVAAPIYEYDYVSGTRRTVLDDWDGGFYGSNAFRKQHADFFEGKLQKGETVYYEVVGFTDTGVPIMPSASNKGLDDDFRKIYGDTTVFSYGCEDKQSDFYVYRMTLVNEDGYVVEYSPDQIRYRCEQMGCKSVPLLWKGNVSILKLIFTLADKEIDSAIEQEIKNYIPDFKVNKKEEEISLGELVTRIAELFYDGPDPVGKNHVREGVVVRIVNRPIFKAYKHKNFNFKVLSGIAIEKADANATDDMLAEM